MGRCEGNDCGKVRQYLVGKARYHFLGIEKEQEAGGIRGRSAELANLAVQVVVACMTASPEPSIRL